MHSTCSNSAFFAGKHAHKYINLMLLLFKSIVEWHIELLMSSMLRKYSSSVVCVSVRIPPFPSHPIEVKNLNSPWLCKLGAVIREVALTRTLFLCWKKKGWFYAPLSQCLSFESFPHDKFECEGDKSRERARRLRIWRLSRAKKICFVRRLER